MNIMRKGLFSRMLCSFLQKKLVLVSLTEGLGIHATVDCLLFDIEFEACFSSGVVIVSSGHFLRYTEICSL